MSKVDKLRPVLLDPRSEAHEYNRKLYPNYTIHTPRQMYYVMAKDKVAA